MQYTAEHVVLKRLENDVEVRDYKNLTLASYHHPDQNTAFVRLLAYIEGENEDHLAIPMSTPVFYGEDDKGQFIAFVIPKGIDKAPEPSDPELEVARFDDYKAASIPLYGLLDDRSFERDRLILEKTLRKNGVKTRGKAFLMRYSSPWTPPLDQKNEVAIGIL